MNRLLRPGCHQLPRSPFAPLRSQFRCRRPLLRPARRCTSTVGIDKTGFIDTEPGESILFFDNVFPLKTAIYDIRYLMMRWDSRGIESRVRKQCLPANMRSEEAPHGFKITGIIPRLKDGGAFLKFVAEDPKAVETELQEFLKQKRLKPWFSPFTRVRSFLVRGKPWLEDLYRFPSARLRVEFVDDGKELSQEALYALFRRYGKIADIIPQDAASKEVPKYAQVQFLRMRSATSARNCLHGYTVPEMDEVLGKEGGVKLRILYERTLKANWLREWIFKHPRIVLPILAVILTTITVAVFDPVRTWFIKAKVTRSLHFSENQYVAWLTQHTIGRFSFGKPQQEMEDLSALWEDRKDSIEKLNAWLQESEETFIVVQGPRGAGKRELIADSILKERKNVLIIDCEPINEAHGDAAVIAAAASQVGYRPVFSWLNSVSSMLDLAAQGTIGTTAGFSQTLENQFNKILQNTGVALKSVALEPKGDNDKDANMSDDEWLAAHPERRPVVVIDNFLHMEGNSIIYERLADWAALLVSANVAHVVFLTNDISFQKSLAKSLPDRVFRSIFLGDAAPASAKRYVLQHLDHTDEKQLTESEKMIAELDEAITALGGRLTDLEFLARRIKTGETPKQAVVEIIEASASEILKLYILSDARGSSRKWTAEQAWYLVSRLSEADGAESDGLRYNEILLHDLFKSGGEDALQALEQAELVSIVNRAGRPWAVKPGKPVYRAAYERLVADKVLKAKMELGVCKALVKVEEEMVKKCEEELSVLKEVDAGRGGKKRAAWIAGKMEGCQERVAEYEKRMGGLKKVLKSEY